MSSVDSFNRQAAVADLFAHWDIAGEGCIRFSELLQILQNSKRVSNKEQVKWVKRLEAQILQGSKLNKATGSSVALNLEDGGVINFSDITGEPSLDPAAFSSLILKLTAKDTAAEFSSFIQFFLDATSEVINSTQGSKQKKDIWDIFRLLDTNHDGHVDLDELEVLLNSERKQDRKQILKWKHYLISKFKSRAMQRRASAVNVQHTLNSSNPASVVAEGKFTEFAATAEGTAAGELEVENCLSMTLAEFQTFIHEYIESDTSRIPILLTAVRKALQQKEVEYITEFRVHDIINDIMEDLLKERPVDVLAGIEKSCARLRRLEKYPKMLRGAVAKKRGSI